MKNKRSLFCWLLILYELSFLLLLSPSWTPNARNVLLAITLLLCAGLIATVVSMIIGYVKRV